METEASSGRYLRRLLWLLIPAGFFSGFDGELRAVLLPELQRSFHVSIATVGLANIPIVAGSFVAFFVIRLADRIGRRPLLLVSLFGYALFTGLTAASTSLWSFALFQSLTQIFIGTEFALAVILISEEAEPAHRGRTLGWLLVASPLGVLFAAIMYATNLDWRSIYLIGAFPAIPIAFARRYIHESRIFLAARGRSRVQTSIRAVLEQPWRTRVLALGFVSFFEKIPVTAAAGWWVYRAQTQLHFSKLIVSIDLAVAVGMGTVGYLVCGRSIDWIGRRSTTTIYLVCASVFGAVLFHLSGEAENFIFLIAAVFFGLGIGPALSALSAESFPTPIRAQAGAIVGNGFATTGELTGPAIVGVLGNRTNLVGGIGGAVSLLCPLLLLAIPILWRFVPETRAARLDAIEPSVESQ